MIQKLILPSLLIASWWCSASESGKTVTQPYSHATERAQHEKKVKKLLHQVAQAESRVRVAIHIWEEEEQFKVYALKLFENSVKTFRSYLNAAGEFEASAAAGGNGAYDMQLDCQERLANERLRLLREQEKYFTNTHSAKPQNISPH